MLHPMNATGWEYVVKNQGVKVDIIDYNIEGVRSVSSMLDIISHPLIAYDTHVWPANTNNCYFINITASPEYLSCR